MITEQLPDEHRSLIIVLVTRAMVDIQHDPDMQAAHQECLDIIARLSGTDTRVTVQRAYASRASK